MEQKFEQVRTIEHPNAKIRVFSPILTKEERARRMQQIHKAAECLLKKNAPTA